MYVIFPLDELLDLNSARRNKRGKSTFENPSHTRPTEEVLPLSQPNQLLPNQLKPPLNTQPKSNLQQPTPLQNKQLKTPPTPPQKQPPTPLPKQPPTPPQKSTLVKTSSKTSLNVPKQTVAKDLPNKAPLIVSPPPQTPPISVTNNNLVNLKNSPSPQQTPAISIQQLPDQVTQRQRSSHSTSTETSSNSSTGAKGKALLSPQPSGGGSAPNRSSWGGSTVADGGAFQESRPARKGSIRAIKDLEVTTEGNTLKVVEKVKSGSAQDISSSSARPPLVKNNSFRSHLSDSCALRPRRPGTEVLKKTPATLSPQIQSQPPVDIPKKNLESAEQQKQVQKLFAVPPTQGPKKAETVTVKAEISVQSKKDKLTAVSEGVKVKQEVPFSAAPSFQVEGSPPHGIGYSHQISAEESLRIQQECLAPEGLPAKAPNQRHPSGKSNSNRGASAGGNSSSSNPKAEGVLGFPRGPQAARNSGVMASNESSFRDLTHPSHNDTLKAHNAFTFKLVKTGPSSGLLEESQAPDGTTTDTELRLTEDGDGEGALNSSSLSPL